MVVYVELAILNNFLISLVLLILTKRLLLLMGKKYRLILSCIFSSTISLVLPLINVPSVLMLFIKILIGFLCVAIAFKTKNAKQLLKNFAVYLILTFGFGGTVYALFYMFKIDINKFQLFNTPFVLGCLGIYVLLFIFAFLLIKLCKIITKHKNVAGFVYKVKLTLNNKTFNTQAFLDSGNRLKDVKTGEGINIVTFSFISKFLNIESLEKLASKQIENLNLDNVHFVEFSSVGASKQQMLVFNANSIEIDYGGTNKKLDNPSIGVIFKKFADTIDYDMLLSGDILAKL